METLIKILFVIAILALAGIVYMFEYYDTKSKKKYFKKYSEDKPCGITNYDIRPCDTRVKDADKYTWCENCELYPKSKCITK